MGSLASSKLPPASEEQKEAIQRELEQILAHPAFKNSTRCLNFLRYIVDKTLEGQAENLKERTLGIEVFGREAEYDMSQDHVVRAAAGEVRKRLAQYYHESGHEDEWRIQLRAGSYVPEFNPPATTSSPGIGIASAAARPHLSYSLIFTVGAAALVVILLALSWLKPHAPVTALDRFWSPLVDSPQRTLVCLLVAPTGPSPVTNSPPPIQSPLGIPFVSLPDTLTLTKITSTLQSRGVKYELRTQTWTNMPDNVIQPRFEELRGGPVVFVGNSDWNMRLTGSLRFHELSDDAANIHFIEDRQNPSSRQWSVPINLPYPKFTEDYAIISRVFDTTTGRTVVAVTGLGLHGTAAAGEFVTDPSYMNAVAPPNSSDWQKKNVQIVISTKIIGETWGPPQVLAKYFW